MGLRQQINQIQVPIDPNNNPKSIEKEPHKWKLLLTQEEILTALLDRNKKHFGKAHGTLFTREPLNDIFDYSVLGIFLEQLEEQQQKLKDLHSSTKAYLNQMQSSAREAIIQQYLTTKSVHNKFCKWRESTTTSPSGLHLGHWRVLSMDYSLVDLKAEDCEIEGIYKRIFLEQELLL